MATFSDPQPCVLIVDDDADTLQLSRQFVLRADREAKVVTAQGAARALAYLLEASRPGGDGVSLPTLILLDVKMPGVGGFELLRWVRYNRSLADIKVVMLSGSEAPADIKRAAELGADGYLIKFPHPAVLACVLHAACGVQFSAGMVPSEAAHAAGGKHRAMQLTDATADGGRTPANA